MCACACTHTHTRSTALKLCQEQTLNSKINTVWSYLRSLISAGTTVPNPWAEFVGNCSKAFEASVWRRGKFVLLIPAILAPPPYRTQSAASLEAWLELIFPFVAAVSVKKGLMGWVKPDQGSTRSTRLSKKRGDKGILHFRTIPGSFLSLLGLNKMKWNIENENWFSTFIYIEFVIATTFSDSEIFFTKLDYTKLHLATLNYIKLL